MMFRVNYEDSKSVTHSVFGGHLLVLRFSWTLLTKIFRNIWKLNSRSNIYIGYLTLCILLEWTKKRHSRVNSICIHHLKRVKLTESTIRTHCDHCFWSVGSHPGFSWGNQVLHCRLLNELIFLESCLQFFKVKCVNSYMWTRYIVVQRTHVYSYYIWNNVCTKRRNQLIWEQIKEIHTRITMVPEMARMLTVRTELQLSYEQFNYI